MIGIRIETLVGLHCRRDFEEEGGSLNGSFSYILEVPYRFARCDVAFGEQGGALRIAS
jgi:hypothetical protein